MKILKLKKSDVLEAIKVACDDGQRFLKPIFKKLFVGNKRVVYFTKKDFIKYLTLFQKFMDVEKEHDPDSPILNFDIDIHVITFMNDVVRPQKLHYDARLCISDIKILSKRLVENAITFE